MKPRLEVHIKNDLRAAREELKRLKEVKKILDNIAEYQEENKASLQKLTFELSEEVKKWNPKDDYTSILPQSEIVKNIMRTQGKIENLQSERESIMKNLKNNNIDLSINNTTKKILELESELEKFKLPDQSLSTSLSHFFQTTRMCTAQANDWLQNLKRKEDKELDVRGKAKKPKRKHDSTGILPENNVLDHPEDLGNKIDTLSVDELDRIFRNGS